MSKNVQGVVLCLLLVLPLLIVVVRLPVVSANVVDDALTLAKAYLDRSYQSLNSTRAVMRDMPGLPLGLQDVNNSHWYCPAKATRAVAGPPVSYGVQFGYYGGCTIDVLANGYDNNVTQLKYGWDTEEDSTYDGVVTDVNMTFSSGPDVYVYVKCVSKAESDTFRLWLNDSSLLYPVVVGATASAHKSYGWFTARFVVRHGTKIAANMYKVLGETSKAQKLYDMWYNSSFGMDAYDALWNCSNTYDDYQWDVVNSEYSPWASCGDLIMPDYRCWGNITWAHPVNGSGVVAVPYRSQLHNPFAFIYCFSDDVDFELLLGLSFWETGWTFKLNWLNHLLNKYGYTADAAALLKSVPWNGIGINTEDLAGITIHMYSCYVTYLLATYLRALSRAYELTQDVSIGARADDVAGRLLGLQVKANGKIYVVDATGSHTLTRPDHVGGFLCGYKWGGGWEFSSAPFWFAEAAFWFMSESYLYYRDLSEYSSMGWTNHETTLFSFAGLWYYKRLNRTPTNYDTSGQSLSMFGVTPSVEASEQGTREYYFSDWSLRCIVAGSIYGQTWVRPTYRWTVNIADHPTTHFAVHLSFYVHVDIGTDGNSLNVTTKLKYVNETLISKSSYKPLDGTGAGEWWFNYDNMSQVNSLSVGSYYLDLSFEFNAGYGGNLYVGYSGSGGVFTEPMTVKAFGWSADFPVACVRTRRDGWFYCPHYLKTLDWLQVFNYYNSSSHEGDCRGAVLSGYPDQVSDGVVDVEDYSWISSKYGKLEYSSGWSYMADVVPDGVCDVSDLSVTVNNYGHTGCIEHTNVTGLGFRFGCVLPNGTSVYIVRIVNAAGWVQVPEGFQNFTVYISPNGPFNSAHVRGVQVAFHGRTPYDAGLP